MVMPTILVQDPLKPYRMAQDDTHGAAPRNHAATGCAIRSLRREDVHKLLAHCENAFVRRLSESCLTTRRASEVRKVTEKIRYSSDKAQTRLENVYLEPGEGRTSIRRESESNRIRKVCVIRLGTTQTCLGLSFRSEKGPTGVSQASAVRLYSCSNSRVSPENDVDCSTSELATSRPCPIDTMQVKILTWGSTFLSSYCCCINFDQSYVNSQRYLQEILSWLNVLSPWPSCSLLLTSAKFLVLGWRSCPSTVRLLIF